MTEGPSLTDERLSVIAANRYGIYGGLEEEMARTILALRAERAKPRQTFEQYVTAINALAVRDGAVGDYRIYCDAEAWRCFYDDDYSPEDAWAEEQSCWDSA